ncbi:MAG: DUF4338 domain-containing protein [Thermodesulfobacteriota bacterium]|nr:DUF4338 domain-containing protein [Thermodesulfobacteriota bacterium]
MFPKLFGYRIVLVETFVDPELFSGAFYKASNWLLVGRTRGFARQNNGYTETLGTSKLIFVKPLVKNARRILSRPFLEDEHQKAGGKMNLKADHLRFGCRREKGRYVVPSESIIRDVLVCLNPDDLDYALRKWNEAFGAQDAGLAIDGKVMCNAVDEDDRQIHAMNAVGHDSNICYTPKKVGTLPVGEDSEEQKQTNEIKIAIPLLEALDIDGKNITADALHIQITERMVWHRK